MQGYQKVAMENQRLIYRVILKVLTSFALMILIWVFVSSLFTQSGKNVKNGANESVVEFDLSAMKKGEIRKLRFGNKDVSVLYREKPINHETLESLQQPNMILHPEDNNYFIYYNHGDSGNCPLFYSKKGLKDVCSGTVFDTVGRDIRNENHGYKLIVPAHYYSGNRLFLGKWVE